VFYEKRVHSQTPWILGKLSAHITAPILKNTPQEGRADTDRGLEGDPLGVLTIFL